MDEVIDRILPYSERMSCPGGGAVLAPGDESTAFYYLKKGKIEVSFTAGDTRIVAAVIGEGSFFGEIGFFDGVSRVRDIRAAEDSVVRVFQKDSLEKLRLERPDLFADLVVLLAKGVCRKFRRVLEERGPLNAYAASLAAGGRSFPTPATLSPRFSQTPEWKYVDRVVEDFKTRMLELFSNLQKDQGPKIPTELAKKGREIMDEFNGHIMNIESYFFDRQAGQCVWEYLFKETYPFFMRGRFAERVYLKPKGYAGDFRMMEMICRDRPEGDGKPGRLVDRWLLNLGTAKGIRRRLGFLAGRLSSVARKRSDQERVDIMSLACGPARELFEFLSKCPFTVKIHATCIDVDPDALRYIDEKVDSQNHGATVRLMTENPLKWALGKVQHSFGMQDVIYSPGLADYLDRDLLLSLLARCHEHLKPGGVVVLCGFADHPDRLFARRILHWDFICRTPGEIEEIFRRSPFGNNVRISAEKQGVNVFAVAEKKS